MSRTRARIKPGRASLIGGIAVGITSFILWIAIAREMGADTAATMLLGACAAIGIGAWIRIADL